MNTDLLRSVAVALGISVCAAAPAESPYVAPAKWNHFRPLVTDLDPDSTESERKSAVRIAQQAGQAAEEAVDEVAEQAAELGAAEEVIEELLPPAASSPAAALTMPTTEPAVEAVSSGEVSPAAVATASPGVAYAPARLPLAPYFGGANLLFMTLEEGSGQQIASGLGSDFSTSVVDPEASTGFDVSLGRYLDGGRTAVGMTYLLWNPSSVSQSRTGAAGTIQAEMPAYRDIEIDAGLGVEDVFEIINGAGGVGYTGATAIEASRDVRFQGIEAKLYGFGLMGASRTSHDCIPKPILGGAFSMRRPCHGYGGASGPHTRPCGGNARILTSHGFRWFQVEDELRFAYDIDGAAGFQATDLYERVDVRNDLFGYQLGSQLTYCFKRDWSVNLGGKFGLYGNRAELQHRLGTAALAANRAGVPGELVDSSATDTSLASLGELEIGLARQFGCAWSIGGGYRLLGFSGVAAAVDSLPDNYVSLASAGQVRADDSYLLHGGYLGLEFNF